MQYLTVYKFVCLPSQQEISHLHSPLDAPLEAVSRSVLTRVADKWLNVILNLNGILCVSKERGLLPKDQVYNLISNTQSFVVRFAIDLKTVFVWLHYLEFLCELNMIANISVWSLDGPYDQEFHL